MHHIMLEDERKKKKKEDGLEKKELQRLAELNKNEDEPCKKLHIYKCALETIQEVPEPRNHRIDSSIGLSPDSNKSCEIEYEK